MKHAELYASSENEWDENDPAQYCDRAWFRKNHCIPSFHFILDDPQYGIAIANVFGHIWRDFEDGESFTRDDLEKMRAKLGVTKRTFKKYIKKLIDGGLLIEEG